MSELSKAYEDVAKELLIRFKGEFGLEDVEGEQYINGLRSGTRWKIDVKGIREDDGATIIVECRRYTTSKLKQEALGALAYRIIDSESAGGIVVSPFEIQSGAKKIAHAENIVEVQIDPNSTSSDFAMKFLNKLFLGMQENLELTDHVTATITTSCLKCGVTFKKNR